MIPIPARVAFLRTILLFQDLTEKDLVYIADEKFLVEKSYIAGEQIIAQDSDINQFFMIFSGKVKITREHEGRQIQLAILESHDYFGDMSWFTRSPSTSNITAIEDTLLLSLSFSDIESLPKQFRKLRASLNTHIQLSIESRKLARYLRFEWLRADEVVYCIARKHYSWLIQTLTTPILLSLVCIPLIIWSISTHSLFVVMSSIILFWAAISLGNWKALDWSNRYYIVTN